MGEGMFVVAIMSCWGKKFIEVGIGFGLLGIVPWCVMVVYNATWEAVAMAMAQVGLGISVKPKILGECCS